MYKFRLIVIIFTLIVSIAGCGVLMDKDRESMAWNWAKLPMKEYSKGNILMGTWILAMMPIGVTMGLGYDMIPYAAAPTLTTAANIAAPAVAAYAVSQTQPENTALIMQSMAHTNRNISLQSNFEVDRSEAESEAIALNSKYRNTRKVHGQNLNFNVGNCLYRKDVDYTVKIENPYYVKRIYNACEFSIIIWDCGKGECKAIFSLGGRSSLFETKELESAAWIVCPSGAQPIKISLGECTWM